MDDVELNEYVVYVKLTIVGETPEDALDYATSAIAFTDLLEQDGVVGIELLDDTIELMEDEDDNSGDDPEVGY
jgi:hypothetical protein